MEPVTEFGQMDGPTKGSGAMAKGTELVSTFPQMDSPTMESGRETSSMGRAAKLGKTDESMKAT